MRWLIRGARARTGMPMRRGLANELMDAARGGVRRCGAVKSCTVWLKPTGLLFTIVDKFQVQIDSFLGI